MTTLDGNSGVVNMVSKGMDLMKKGGGPERIRHCRQPKLRAAFPGLSLVHVAIIFTLAVLMSSPLLGQDEPDRQRLQQLANSAAAAFEDGFHQDVIDWIAPEIQRIRNAGKIQPEEVPLVLLMAEACLEASDPSRALEVLDIIEKQKDISSPVEYDSIRANALVRLGRYSDSIASFERYIRERGQSVELPVLESYLNTLLQAGMFARIDEWFNRGENRRLLERSAGTSQSTLVDLELVHTEALFRARQFSSMEEVTARLSDSRLTARQLWKLRYLEAAARLERSNSSPEPEWVESLRPLAQSTGDPEAVWKSVLLESKALLISRDYSESRTALQALLNRNVADDYRGEALLRLAQTYLEEGNYQAARSWLEKFEKNQKSESILGWVWLTMAQIHFEEFRYFRDRSMPAEARDSLQKSLRKAEDVVNLIPGSNLGSYARFHLGWCLEASNQLVPALEEFEAACSLFPPGKHQVESLLKVAELLLQTEQYGMAESTLSSVQDLMDRFSYGDVATRSRVDLAQVRVFLRTSRPDRAGTIVERLCMENPELDTTIQAVLLYSQYLTDEKRPAEALELLHRMDRATDSPHLQGMIRENILYALIRDNEWDKAREVAGQWISSFPDHPSFPDVYLQLCYLTLQTLGPAEAIHSYTRFVSRFPEHPRSPSIQFWIAQQHFDQRDYEIASRTFQTIINKESWTDQSLKWEAGLKHCQCLIELGRFDESRDSLNSLIEALQENLPDDASLWPLHGQCHLVLAESWLRESDEAQASIRARNTLTAFEKKWPEHPMVDEVRNYAGRLILRSSTSDMAALTLAENLFSRTAGSGRASPSLKAEAEFGLGNLKELRASRDSLNAGESRRLLAEAATHYRKIFYQSTADVHPFWIKKSGLSAISLMTRIGDLQQANRARQRFIQMFPGESSLLQSLATGNP